MSMRCYEGKLEAVKSMVEKGEAEAGGADGDGRSPVHWAAAGGQDDVLEWLVRQPGVSVNSGASGGASPLSSATAAGNTSTVKRVR